MLLTRRILCEIKARTAELVMPDQTWQRCKHKARGQSWGPVRSCQQARVLYQAQGLPQRMQRTNKIRQAMCVKCHTAAILVFLLLQHTRHYCRLGWLLTNTEENTLAKPHCQGWIGLPTMPQLQPRLFAKLSLVYLKSWKAKRT